VNSTRIGGPIRTNLFRRLNYDALDRITTVVDAQNRRVGWGLPLDGNIYPSEVWWLHMDDGHWEPGASPAHSAMFSFIGAAPVTYGDLPGIYGTYAGLGVTTYGGIQPQTAPKPKVIFGFTNGKTYQSDPTKTADNTTAISGEFISRAFVPVGQQVEIGGQPHTISPKDSLILDEVTLTLVDQGTNISLTLYATADNGKSWTSLGTMALTSNGGTTQTPVLVEKSLHSRFAFKDHVQIRIVPFQIASFRCGFTDGTIHITVTGRKQR